MLFERTVKRVRGEKAGERYARVAIAAAKQCGRLFLPGIDRPGGLREVLEQLQREYPAALLLVGSLAAAARPMMQVETGGRDVVAIVGPEGGLTDEEERLLGKHGAQAVRLTDTVLRVETAAVGFVAVLAAQREGQGEGFSGSGDEQG